MKFYQKGNFKTSPHQMGKKPQTIRTKEKEKKKERKEKEEKEKNIWSWFFNRDQRLFLILVVRPGAKWLSLIPVWLYWD